MMRLIALILLTVLPIASAEVAVGNITEILPQAAWQRQQQGALLVDVREDDERAQGMAEGALGVPMDILQVSPSVYLPDQQAPILLICRSGRRSKQVAAQLMQQGYTQVFSVAGGTLRWQEDGLPMATPEP